MSTEKIILSDVDGTVLNWCDSFDAYMASNGLYPKNTTLSDFGYSLDERYDISSDDVFKHIDAHHNSDYFSNLAPLHDSVEYIERLEKSGYKIIFISTFGDCKNSYELRYKNLINVFGNNVIKDLIQLPIGSPKKPSLLSWSNTKTIWVEDHPNHALAGVELGLKTILIDYSYNRHVTNCIRVPPESAWKHVYRLTKM